MHCSFTSLFNPNWPKGSLCCLYFVLPHFFWGRCISSICFSLGISDKLSNTEVLLMASEVSVAFLQTFLRSSFYQFFLIPLKNSVLFVNCSLSFIWKLSSMITLYLTTESTCKICWDLSAWKQQHGIFLAVKAVLGGICFSKKKWFVRIATGSPSTC